MATVRVERRLAAIVAADIVGYSRLVEADEAGTLAAIKVLRWQVLDPLLAAHQGRIVKLMGDGAIVEFGSAVGAVAFAVAMQHAVAAHQAEVSADKRIVYRIGVNLGDIVVEGDDLLGQGVNIAARLEALSEPGGIYVTDTVLRQLDGKTKLAFEDAGERALKNILQPVRVWRWAVAATSVARGTSLPLPDRPSVAVLPFDNLSGQAEETYFSDGISADIITGLVRFRRLFVIARNSSFAFRGKPIELAEIGRRLGVSYIVEGSVRRAGDRVRITVQLIEAASGAHLWAERYDRTLGDIFAVQDEVAHMIVATLLGRIEEAGLWRSAQTPTASLTAYDCLLRGMAYFRGYSADNNQKAYEMFERAIMLDPRYGLAHACLADVRLALHGNASAPASVLDAAFVTATQAVELDPHESRCHRTLAFIWLYRRDYDTAEHHFRRALDLNPNDADRRMQMGHLLALRGRPEEALGLMRGAIRLNPCYPAWYNTHLAIPLYSLRRYSEAAQALNRLPSLGPWSRARLAACYGQLGREQEAQAQTEAILRVRPEFSTMDFLRHSVLLERAEDREHLSDGLIKAGLPE
jgi:TolB-like protein/class 3 adenylate cyclase/Tfp pilus assembly protein PilF